MLENLIVVAGQVLTLFIMMAVGFVLRKMLKLGDEFLSHTTFLLLKIIAPCIIVNSLQMERNAELMLGLGLTAAAAGVYFAIGVVGSMLIYRKTEPDKRAVLRFGSIYPNTGFMGFPLVAACLGDGAAIYAGIFMVVFTLVHWTHGVMIMDKNGGLKGAGLRSALLNPGTIGFLVGFTLFALNLRLPTPLGRVLEMFSGVNSPLAMIVIGAQIADADVLKLFKQRELYVVSALKLVVLPAIAAFAILPLGLPQLPYRTAIILAGTPCAAVTAMFARQYGRDSATAARLVSLCTLLSILTLPVLAAIVKQVG